jgi:ferredoxin, 2Fe-2S
VDADELHIRVMDADGGEHRLPALEGWSVMEIVRDAGLPLRAECGGVLQCTGCHVYVDPTWFDHIPPMQPQEEALLREAPSRRPLSRLSCQIPMTRELDGLLVTLTPETGG